MTLKSGYPFWLVKNGLPFTYPKLDRNTTTEVAILGAGISGALARYYLLEAGIDCLTIDARTIGLGSTSASTSLLQYEIDEPLINLTQKIGRNDAEKAYKLCGRAIEELEKITKHVGIEYFERKKSLYYAAYKKDVKWLKEEFEARKAAGFNVKWLEPEEVQQQYGFASYGAILSELAAQTNAYMLAHCLLRHKYKEGTIYDRSTVVDIKHSKSGVVLTTEDGFTIKAKTLVYAVGYEVVHFIEKDIVKLMSTYATISEQYNERKFWKDELLIWNTANPYLYLRTTPDNRVLVGGRDEEFFTPWKRDRLLKKKVKQLKGDVDKLFPELDFKPEFSWTGTFGSTKDGLPYIGAYEGMPNGYFCLGFGGNGITFSQIGAEIIRDMILGKENENARLFRFNR